MREWLTTEIVCRMLVLDIPHTDLAEVIMVRIGINIPNELMKRLEPLKRELNISQVCREALTAKAEGHERMLSRLENDDVALAIDRLLEQEKGTLGGDQLRLANAWLGRCSMLGKGGKRRQLERFSGGYCMAR